MNSSYYAPEPEVAHLYASLFCDSYVIPGIYEDCHPLLEVICGHRPLSNTDSSSQEEYFFQDYISSMNWEEEAYSANSSHDRQVQSFNNWTNLDSGYRTCFSFNYYFSNGDGSAEDGAFDKIKDSFDWEESHRDSYSGYYENSEHQLACADRPWPGYESCLGRASEEDMNYFGRQEPRHAYSCYNHDEMGLYEALFGCWPCLMQKHQNVTAY